MRVIELLERDGAFWRFLGVLAVLLVVSQIGLSAFPDGLHFSQDGRWNGVAHRTTNISYASENDRHANSYFDIYRADRGTGTPGDAADLAAHPVFVYIHGGGYVQGSKDPQDTTCMGPGAEALFEELLKDGIDVVCMDYALANDGNYPEPVYQVGMLMHYLRDHAGELGIDMEHVLLGGGSAGGQIAAQYALVQTNGVYAAHMAKHGISPALKAGSLKGIYLGCALLDPTQFASTGNAKVDETYQAMQRAYFGTGGAGAANAEEARIAPNATADFPPAYITDGNYLTFDDQAIQLDAQLGALGVEHRLRVFGTHYSRDMPHGYDVQDCPEAYDNAHAAASFLAAALG